MSMKAIFYDDAKARLKEVIEHLCYYTLVSIGVL